MRNSFSSKLGIRTNAFSRHPRLCHSEASGLPPVLTWAMRLRRASKREAAPVKVNAISSPIMPKTAPSSVPKPACPSSPRACMRLRPMRQPMRMHARIPQNRTPAKTAEIRMVMVIDGRKKGESRMGFPAVIAGIYFPAEVIPLTCFSSESRLQSPGRWLGGNSFNVSRNLLATVCSGTSTKARSMNQS